MSFIKNYSKILSQTVVLWITFTAFLIITATLVWISKTYGFDFLDGMSKPETVRAAIASMSEEQRSMHAWINATLDIIFPAVYGALFIGSAYKFFPTQGQLLALPILVLVPIDLIEGMIQILGLTGIADLIALKIIVTPVKFLLFFFGLFVCIIGWIRWAKARLSDA